ncbi:hypothetical protein MVEN_02447700 [Mycena venus]|uniref:Uncharacterized protein n=1 Tax=Mycena venus TaxID=2733690 RepID=A0A8H7CB12_9AGAR|nr:hypothetical protein MVEN_02447700 [Mycena venus]
MLLVQFLHKVALSFTLLSVAWKTSLYHEQFAIVAANQWWAGAQTLRSFTGFKGPNLNCTIPDSWYFDVNGRCAAVAEPTDTVSLQAQSSQLQVPVISPRPTIAIAGSFQVLDSLSTFSAFSSLVLVPLRLETCPALLPVHSMVLAPVVLSRQPRRDVDGLLLETLWSHASNRSGTTSGDLTSVVPECWGGLTMNFFMISALLIAAVLTAALDSGNSDGEHPETTWNDPIPTLLVAAQAVEAPTRPAPSRLLAIAIPPAQPLVPREWRAAASPPPAEEAHAPAGPPPAPAIPPPPVVLVNIPRRAGPAIVVEEDPTAADTAAVPLPIVVEVAPAPAPMLPPALFRDVVEEIAAPLATSALRAPRSPPALIALHPEHIIQPAPAAPLLGEATFAGRAANAGPELVPGVMPAAPPPPPSPSAALALTPTPDAATARPTDEAVASPSSPNLTAATSYMSLSELDSFPCRAGRRSSWTSLP